jgi:tetratricopeptide (TPR) repeat protein
VHTVKKTSLAVLMALSFTFALQSFALAQSAGPQATLNQYISDLQKNPDDYAVREKIIRHVQTMKSAPAVPEEARRQYIMGKTLFEDARSVQDFNDAIEKFRKALLIAPWWPEANRDLGMTLQAAQQYDEAIKALKLYIATNPGEELSRRARNEIYKIEAKQEKAAKEKTASVTQARVEEKKKGLRDLAGNWYRKEPYDHRLSPYDGNYHYKAEMRGDELIFIEVTDVSYWGGNRGSEKAWFVADRLDGNHLIGRPAVAVEGVVEITVSRDFNEWEFSHKSQYGVARKTYMRK